MKKLFPVLLLFAFHLSVCLAQDTISLRKGKKIVGKVISVGKTRVLYTILPDTSQREISTFKIDYIFFPGGTKFYFVELEKPPPPSTSDFFLSGNAGLSVPSIAYRDGIVGLHFGIRPTYYFNHVIGITAIAATDFNGTGLDYISKDYWGGLYIFQQYLAGLTYRTGGKPGFPFVDFVGLFGLCKVNTPVTEQGGGANPLTVSTPGNGSGLGSYFGVDFTSSSDHFVSVTFGAGFLYTVFSYPDYTSTVSTYYPNTSVTRSTTLDGDTKMGLVLYQMYVAINFRVKKAGK